MSDSILDEVREILQKSSTISFGQEYVIGLVAELEATQGVLSRVQEARVDDIARSEKAEAENARLTKMVDWLAEKQIRCAANGEQWYGPTIGKGLHVPMYSSKTEAISALVEAANRAVATGEETCQK